MWKLLDILILKLKGYRYLGHVRYKDESLAPKEWKTTIWQKLKNNDLFQPININNSENYKEIKLFVAGKVVIISINIFLYSFIYAFAKDSYTIIGARYNLYKVEQINFQNKLPEELEFSYNWKKFKYNNTKDIHLKKELHTENLYREYIINKAKTDYIEQNYNNIKSNIISFGNHLLVIYLILKYYWKRKKTP